MEINNPMLGASLIYFKYAGNFNISDLEFSGKTINIVFDDTKSLPIGSLNLRFNKVSILYNNQIIKAGIAHSFASQALPNAYEIMAEYGKFCYENLHSNKIS